jgi:hypothetical protein
MAAHDMATAQSADKNARAASSAAPPFARRPGADVAAVSGHRKPAVSRNRVRRGRILSLNL